MTAGVEITVRPATLDDAEAICAIYNQGIEDRIATLETQLRTPSERRQWLASRGPSHPVIVAEVNGRVIGWGSLNVFNPRDAYRYVADFSVYVERGSRGTGIGRRLLERLIELARDIGYHKMVLSAFAFNEPGMALYARMGFTRVGIYREQGLLDGKWVDTLIMEKLLFPGTIEVHERHRFDLGALERYLVRHIAGVGGPLVVRQYEGGQSNPTYYVKAGEREFVLRRKPPGTLLPSAHLVEREYRILTALAQTDVPVPRTHVLCEDPTVIGTAFYIMDCVRGRVFTDPRIPGLAPRERAAVYDSMADVLARLHRVDWQALGLADYGRPGNYFARQIHRWTEQYRASETETIPSMERLIEWLPRHIPADDQTSIAHGDYRLANLLIHPTEPRVVAVLDWELSTLGHPLADLAYSAMVYRLPRALFDGLADQEVESLGVPSEAEYVAAYCRRVGREDIPGWDFYLAFGMFRLAAIVQGIMGRVLSGTAAAANARERGAMARPLADAALAVIASRAGN